MHRRVSFAETKFSKREIREMNGLACFTQEKIERQATKNIETASGASKQDRLRAFDFGEKRNFHFWRLFIWKWVHGPSASRAGCFRDPRRGRRCRRRSRMLYRGRRGRLLWSRGRRCSCWDGARRTRGKRERDPKQ